MTLRFPLRQEAKTRPHIPSAVLVVILGSLWLGVVGRIARHHISTWTLGAKMLLQVAVSILVVLPVSIALSVLGRRRCELEDESFAVLGVGYERRIRYGEIAKVETTTEPLDAIVVTLRSGETLSLPTDGPVDEGHCRLRDELKRRAAHAVDGAPGAASVAT
jgi:hypothetical protein